MNKLFSIAILLSGLVTVSAGLAQTCNPNIPLRTPNSEFTDHGDGTVTHQRTGLTWIKCLQGKSGADCSSGTTTSMTWDEALARADNRVFAGYSDWRLPNIKELASLVEIACYTPAINLSFFPNDPSTGLWSSSTHNFFKNAVSGFHFNAGADYVYYKHTYNYVRLVRGGQ